MYGGGGLSSMLEHGNDRNSQVCQRRQREESIFVDESDFVPAQVSVENKYLQYEHILY